MKNLFLGLMALVVGIFTTGCASSKMDVQDRVEIPVLLGDKVYTNTFVHTDKSKIAPGGPRTIRHGGGGSSFRFSAGVGGGGYGYGGAYPVISVPLESQGAFQAQTAERYGLGGGGSYSPTPAGSFSPTPSVGGRYGY